MKKKVFTLNWKKYYSEEEYIKARNQFLNYQNEQKQADQKKFIGNAVEVTQARKNTEVLCKVLKKLRLKKSKETI